MDIDRREMLLGTAAVLAAATTPPALVETGAVPAEAVVSGALSYQELPLYTRLVMACDWLGWNIGIVFGSQMRPEPQFVLDSVADWMDAAFDAGARVGYGFYREPTRLAAKLTDEMLDQVGPRLREAIDAAAAAGFHYRQDTEVARQSVFAPPNGAEEAT